MAVYTRRASPPRPSASAAAPAARPRAMRRDHQHGLAAQVGRGECEQSVRQRDSAGSRAWPGALSTRCGHPCARRCAAKWRGRDRAAELRPAPPSACSNSRKMRACCSGAMPMPVSRTWNTISPGAAPGSTMTLTPPASVNLMALPARLSSTWRSRVGSPMTRSGNRSSTSDAISRPLAWARGPNSSTISSTSGSSANGRGSSSSLPASILEKSRTSSISDSSASPEVLVALR